MKPPASNPGCVKIRNGEILNNNNNLSARQPSSFPYSPHSFVELGHPSNFQSHYYLLTFYGHLPAVLGFRSPAPQTFPRIARRSFAVACFPTTGSNLSLFPVSVVVRHRIAGLHRRPVPLEETKHVHTAEQATRWISHTSPVSRNSLFQRKLRSHWHAGHSIEGV